MIKKKNGIKLWALKIFLITLVLTAGVSVAAESLMGNLPIAAAAFIIVVIILIGIMADLVGIAFATCDAAPFISMASRKIKRAKSAIKLLKNADIVANICNDVIGDVCGIVSGAAGAAVATSAALSGSMSEILRVIIISSVIAALTVSGKAAGKSFALRKNKEIVSFISSIVMVFVRSDNNNSKNKKSQCKEKQKTALNSDTKKSGFVERVK